LSCCHCLLYLRVKNFSLKRKTYFHKRVFLKITKNLKIYKKTKIKSKEKG